MKSVTVYALSTCSVCKQVKRFLEENTIPYTLIEVDTLDSGEQWLMTRELQKHNPKATFPTVIIQDVVLGYDLDSLRQKLLDPQQGS
jgi:glutaredoxin-like protein NrdH